MVSLYFPLFNKPKWYTLKEPEDSFGASRVESKCWVLTQGSMKKGIMPLWLVTGKPSPGVDLKPTGQLAEPVEQDVRNSFRNEEPCEEPVYGVTAILLPPHHGCKDHHRLED